MSWGGNGLSEWWRKVRGKPTEQELAEQQVEQARDDIAKVRDRVVAEVDNLKREQMMHRAELQQAVHSRAPQHVLMNLTKKLKQVENQIGEKEKLMANVHRETTQLADAGTNAKVAAAYMQSVDAQQALARLDLGGKEVDDVLDDVEDNRMLTRELTDRLGSLGGEDEDLVFDEEGFDATAVIQAMGVRTDYKEDILVQECKAMMQEHWQPDVPSYAQHGISRDMGLAVADGLRQRTNQVQSTQSLQLHGYNMPSAPTNRTSAMSHEQFDEEKEVQDILARALAPPRTEY